MEYFGIAIPMIIIGIIYFSCEMISNHRDKYYADVCKEFTLIMSSLDSDEKEIMYDVSHYASTCRFKKTPVHEFKDDMIDLLDFYKKNDVASDDLIVKIIEIVF